MRNLKTFDALFEAAKDFINIPASAGLVIYSNDIYAKNLHLYDFKEQKCIGTISMCKLGRTKKTLWSIVTVAAEPGFGPLMYKCAMMTVHPDGVCPYRGSIRPDAIKIWQVFDKKPDELTKSIIDPDDPAYYDFGVDDINWVLNMSYTRPPSFWFKKRLSIGEEMMDKYDIDAKTIDTVCKKYFSSRYDR